MAIVCVHLGKFIVTF